METKQSCCMGSCGCSAGMDRRTFLKLSAAAGAAAMLGSQPAVAGPFTRADFDKLVPADKKLSPDWVRSLFERGSRTVYRGAELEKIGMPIGGICAGQLYLGGDGKLWHWDIFNRHVGTGAEHYAKPMKPASPLEQGFAHLDRPRRQTQIGRSTPKDLREISFIGEYPIGYRRISRPRPAGSRFAGGLQPFVPLNVKDSSLPATVMRFTVKNTGTREGRRIDLAGWLENGVCLYSGKERDGAAAQPDRCQQGCLRDARMSVPNRSRRGQRQAGTRDIVFDDFEKQTYEGWKATGTAFGTGPDRDQVDPRYQGDVGGHGDRVVNSHATAPGDSVEQKDAAVGTLTSQTVHDRAELHQLPDRRRQPRGQDVHQPAGRRQDRSLGHRANDNRMKPQGWAVRQWAGKTARLVIVDNETGGWGNIGIDEIVFSDKPAAESGPLQEEPDFGTMGLALLEPKTERHGHAATCRRSKPLDAILRRRRFDRIQRAAAKRLSDKARPARWPAVLLWLPANRPSHLRHRLAFPEPESIATAS